MLQFLTTFAQPSVRLKNFLGGWLLVLGQLVECATVCVKSVVILASDKLIVVIVKVCTVMYAVMCRCLLLQNRLLYLIDTMT